MTTERQHINDGFSFGRVGELYRYYWPVIRPQVYIYLALSLVAAALILLPYNDIAKVLFFSLFGTLTGWGFMFAACIFTRHGDNRIVERLLPASGAEKLVFFLSYLLVVITAVTYLPYYTALWLYPTIYHDSGTIMYSLAEISRQTPFVMNLFSILNNATTTLLCLFVILKARNNRVLKAVFSVIGYTVIVSFITGIATAATTLDNMPAQPEISATSSFRDAFIDGLRSSLENSKELIEIVMESKGAYIGMEVAIGIVLLVIVCGIYRQLCKKNI